MSLTDIETLHQEPGAPLTAATGEKARRQMPESTRRILLIILSVLVLVASVAGFYFTSDVFDERTPVLVTAIDIQQGDAITATVFKSELADMGSIPHIAYTPDAPYAFEGFVATQPIPAGTVVLASMMTPADQQPFGNELELTVQFDTTLVTDPVFDGDVVLLVDPGAVPTAENPGRPQQAIGSLILRNYENGSMTMFLEPETWSYWKDLPQTFGALPRILPVPLGGDAEQFAQEINAVWASEHEAQAVEAAPTEQAGPQAGPGEFEVVVTFDTSLVPSGVSEGDTVLMIDPGQPPTTEDFGRPRMVLRTIQLENFDGSAMKLFVPPDEWQEWLRLRDTLGADPMVLPISEGTDIEEVTQSLNQEWEAEWQLAIIDLSEG